MPTSATPTLSQAPGAYTIPTVDDNRGWRFTGSLTRPVPTTAIPNPNWTLTVSMPVGTPPPANPAHRVALTTGSGLGFIILASDVPDNPAMEAKLKALYDHLADALIPASAAVVS